MSKNIMPDIAKLLGVEINEEFKLEGETVLTDDFDFCVTEKYILFRKKPEKEWHQLMGQTVHDLFNGTLEIIRKPFKPKYDEIYWSYCFGSRESDWQIVWTNWKDNCADYLRLNLNLCFRTEEEAERARPRVYRELTGRKWQ